MKNPSLLHREKKGGTYRVCMRAICQRGGRDSNREKNSRFGFSPKKKTKKSDQREDIPTAGEAVVSLEK